MLKTERAIIVDPTNTWARAKDVATAINRDGAQHPTLARASEDVTVVAMLLDTLEAPSFNGVDKVYRQLKDILDITAAQQAESSL
jgi:hypothetical protein